MPAIKPTSPEANSASWTSAKLHVVHVQRQPVADTVGAQAVQCRAKPDGLGGLQGVHADQMVILTLNFADPIIAITADNESVETVDSNSPANDPKTIIALAAHLEGVDFDADIAQFLSRHAPDIQVWLVDEDAIDAIGVIRLTFGGGHPVPAAGRSGEIILEQDPTGLGGEQVFNQRSLASQSSQRKQSKRDDPNERDEGISGDFLSVSGK